MSNPKIRRFQVRAVRVPMEPHRTASGAVTESPLVLTDVFADDGTVGHSIIFTYNAAALKPTAELIANLGELIAGQELAPVAIADQFAARFPPARHAGTRRHGSCGHRYGAVGRNGVARAQHVDPCGCLEVSKSRSPAYGAVGYDGVADSARGAEVWAKLGFRGIKVKIGYPNVAEDLDVIRSIRKAIGDEMAIMVDYNQSLTPAAAVERLRFLDDEGLTWIEEPVRAHDYRGHAHVAREIRTPIQCGENWWGPHDMREAIETHASDYMMPDVMKIGGVTGWTRAAALAQAHSIPISNHLWPELSAQLMCASPTAHYLEYANWWNPIVKDPLLVEKGMTNVENVAGGGVEWNEAAIARFAA